MPETNLAPVAALGVALLVFGFEQIVQSRFGVMGVIGFTLLAVGVKARNTTCSCLGAFLLAMLLAH
jgi:hypothetical protein